MPPTDCAYLGPETGRLHDETFPLRVCRRHGECCESADAQRIPCCPRCNDRLPQADPEFARKWRDPLVMFNRELKQCDSLRNLLAGRSAFLACGGPSANDLPLEELNRRGVWTLAVNNMAGHARFRANAFVCADPPMKFSHSIWHDPAIIKLVPRSKMTGQRARIRRKAPDGTFSQISLGRKQWATTADCPNVWGFSRRSWLRPDDSFFTEPDAAWGNHNSGVGMTAEPKTVSTLLLALRLMRYLGARRVFLVGVDFGMSETRGYAFPQARTADACAANNRQYEVQNAWLCRMAEAGLFEKYGMEVFNTFGYSRLRAFPYVPFETALEDVRGDVEETPDTFGWYEK